MPSLGTDIKNFGRLSNADRLALALRVGSGVAPYLNFLPFATTTRLARGQGSEGAQLGAFEDVGRGIGGLGGMGAALQAGKAVKSRAAAIALLLGGETMGAMMGHAGGNTLGHYVRKQSSNTLDRTLPVVAPYETEQRSLTSQGWRGIGTGLMTDLGYTLGGIGGAGAGALAGANVHALTTGDWQPVKWLTQMAQRKHVPLHERPHLSGRLMLTMLGGLGLGGLAGGMLGHDLGENAGEALLRPQNANPKERALYKLRKFLDNP